MGRKDIKCSHWDIVNYWAESGLWVTEDGILTKRSDSIRDEIVMDDCDAVRCMACGAMVKSGIKETDDWSRLWNSSHVKSRLARCHIIPQSLGGADTPDNLVVLCKACHESSPDTTNPQTFWRWFYDTRRTHVFGLRSPSSLIKDINEELARRKLPSVLEIFQRIVDEGQNLFCEEYFLAFFRDYASKHTSLHFGKGVKHSSMIACFVDWLVEYCETYNIKIEKAS